MSRTKLPRNQKRIDYNPTPAWCVHRLLEEVYLPGGHWLEPAVGDGAIVRAVNAVRGDIIWTTIDIRPECEPDLVADFTAPLYAGAINAITPDGLWDVCITNPPFSQAEEFVRSALKRSDYVAMLLRVGWLASDDRNAWLRMHEPNTHVLPNRPSFRGDGGTDATDYAWMIWQRGRTSPAELHILRTTPLGQRRGS